MSPPPCWGLAATSLPPLARKRLRFSKLPLFPLFACGKRFFTTSLDSIWAAGADQTQTWQTGQIRFDWAAGLAMLCAPGHYGETDDQRIEPARQARVRARRLQRPHGSEGRPDGHQ